MDELAKAATYPSTPRPPDLVQLRTSVKRKIKAEFRALWAQVWKGDSVGRKLFELVETPHLSTLNLYRNTPGAFSRTIIRART